MAKKKKQEPEREFTFEYGHNPPTMDERVSYVRYIFEKRFKAKFLIEILFLLVVVATVVFFLLWYFF